MGEADAIRATRVTKSFGRTLAVDGVDLVVGKGEVVALLGPSGSGKTTLLRIVAGFEAPDEGDVAIGGRAVAGSGGWVEPDKRRVGMVFQDGALFPHLDVAANVGFGNPRPGQVEACLALVGLAGRAKSYPHELSGGERQRVALARALAVEPAVVLLDEPFASLDTALRTALREEVVAILRRAGASALLVTHDQQEALSLADTVVLLRDGRVEQVADPRTVYSRPVSRWAAEFLGAVDVVPARVEGSTVASELGRFDAGAVRGQEAYVLVRPEAVAVGPAGPIGRDANGATGTDRVAVTVVGRSFYGPDQVLTLRLASGQELRSRRPGHDMVAVGDELMAWVDGPVTVVARDPLEATTS